MLKPGRAPGDPGDHPAAPPAAVGLLLAVVRPDRAAARAVAGDPERLHLPAGIGEALPAAARPRGADGRGRASSESATWCSRAASSRSTPAPRRSEPVPGRDRSMDQMGGDVNRTAVPPPVTVVLDAADAWLPARMEAVEERLRAAGRGPRRRARAPTPARPSPPAASGCGRCSSCSAPGPRRGEAAVRAAAAIELVHMATLVHDDVLDAAPLRRGRPTVVAALRPRPRALATGDLLFSRAFAELAERRRRARRSSSCPSASVALALGELAQRRDAFDTRSRRRALPGSLPAEDGPPVRVRLPDRPRRRWRAGTTRRTCERRFGFGRDRARLPAARRRPRRHRPAGAHRQGPRHRPPRRHRHPAADPGPRARSLARRRRPAGLDADGAEAVCDRIAATGALEEVRADARRAVETAKRRARGAVLDAEQRQLLELVADGVVERYS